MTNMTLFNKRKEIKYYEIFVYDEKWNTIPFASSDKLINVPYLSQKTVEIYIREIDCERIEYICTTSRRFVDDAESTGIDSRICSKV